MEKIDIAVKRFSNYFSVVAFALFSNMVHNFVELFTESIDFLLYFSNLLSCLSNLFFSLSIVLLSCSIILVNLVSKLFSDFSDVAFDGLVDAFHLSSPLSGLKALLLDVLDDKNVHPLSSTLNLVPEVDIIQL